MKTKFTLVRDVRYKLGFKFVSSNFPCGDYQENGRRSIVVPKASSSKESSIVGLAKYAWSGYVLECQKCGVIYRYGLNNNDTEMTCPHFRSRQQWYGNTDPEFQGVVQTEIAHVWPGVRPDQIIYTTKSFCQVSNG